MATVLRDSMGFQSSEPTYLASFYYNNKYVLFIIKEFISNFKEAILITITIREADMLGLLTFHELLVLARRAH